MPSELFSRPFLVRLETSVEVRIESARAGTTIRDMRTGIAPGVIVVSIGVCVPVLFARRIVAFGLNAAVVVPQVEFVSVVVVGVEECDGRARITGRAIKPSPATTPNMATRVNLALEPTFKLRSPV